MAKVKGACSGSCMFGDIELEYYADVTADYEYDPGCYRTKNGDGWPPSESYDDLEFEVTEVHAYLDDNEIEVTEEMWAACQAAADSLTEDAVEWGEPEWDEGPEWEDEPEWEKEE